MAHHQFEIECGQNQQQALKREPPRLQFELGQPGLTDATGLEGQLLLAQVLLPPDALEDNPQLGRGADHLLDCSHDLLGFLIVTV